MIGPPLPSLAHLDRSAGATLIWLATTPADMRCGFDRLADLAKVVTEQDPTTGHLFLFRSRGGTDSRRCTGTATGTLWYKRLEQGVFKLPRPVERVKSVELRASELAMLLDGIDLRSVKRVPRYQKKK